MSEGLEELEVESKVAEQQAESKRVGEAFSKAEAVGQEKKKKKRKQTQLSALHVFLANFAWALVCTLGGLEGSHDSRLAVEELIDAENVANALVNLGEREKLVAIGIPEIEELVTLALLQAEHKGEKRDVVS